MTNLRHNLKNKKRKNFLVYMFVMNNCAHDARVLKEAKTLSTNGYQVKIIAVLDKTTIPYELRDKFEIIRIKRNPIHYKLLRLKRKSNIYSQYFLKTIHHKIIYLTFIFIYNEMVWWKKWIKSLLLLFFDLFRHIFLNNFIKLKPYIFKQDSKLLKIKNTIFKKYIIKFFKTIYNITFKLINQINKFNKALIISFYRFSNFADYWIRAYKIVSTSPGDIYHANDLNTLPIAWWLKERTKKYLIYDSHELYTEINTFNFIERFILKLIERILITKCDEVITVNNSIANEFAKRYHVKYPVIIKNCPLTEKKYNLNKTNLFQKYFKNLSLNYPIILYHGGFSPNRGLENLILSTEYLNKGSIIFMGWGRIEEKLKKLAEKLKLRNKRIFFLPPVSQDQLLRWVSSAHIGVIPYRSVGLNNYYSSPNKLFEYINGGIPIVGSNFPEIKKVIFGHQIGSVFNPENPKDMAYHINSITLNFKNYHRIKKNVSVSSQFYNWEKESKKLLLLYSKLRK